MSGADSSSDRFQKFLPAILLFVLPIAAYLPAVWNAGFVWDDSRHVLFEEHLRGLAGLWKLWFEPGASQQFYPLVYTSFWIEYYLWGLKPFGYHVVNVVLHAVNALLLWRVLRVLEVPGAWLAAALFALHPVHVESVAWISERKNVLSGMFYFGSALCYLRWRGEEKWRWVIYAASLVLFVCALLSKSVTASLPAALLVVFWWKDGRIDEGDVRALLPFFVVGVIAGLFTSFVENIYVGAAGAEWDLSFADRCLIAGRAVWFYLWKLLWPAELIFVYPRWEPDPAAVWQWLFPAAVVGVLAGLWALRGRIGRGALAAALFFGGTALPALGFVNFYPMRYSFVADHYVYLASLGPIVLVAAGIAAWPAARKALPVIATLVLLVLAGLAWRQAQIYLDLPTLYRDTIAKNSEAGMARYNLGLLLVEAGEYEAALEQYEGALEVNPEHIGVLLSIGQAHSKLGRDDLALRYYREAVNLRPDYVPAIRNIGNVIYRGGDRELAEHYWRLAERLDARLDRIDEWREEQEDWRVFFWRE